jgi:hypothetical protein
MENIIDQLPSSSRYHICTYFTTSREEASHSLQQGEKLPRTQILSVKCFHPFDREFTIIHMAPFFTELEHDIYCITIFENLCLRYYYALTLLNYKDSVTVISYTNFVVGATKMLSHVQPEETSLSTLMCIRGARLPLDQSYRNAMCLLL